MEIFAITIEKALEMYDMGALFVDARSENEFADGTIPGSINVPILDNDERHTIGTTYKEKGGATARRDGVDIVSPKIPTMISAVEESLESRKQAIVVFCWRGGMRSKALTTFLDLAGYRVFQLQGGYKAFRRHVLDFFETAQWARLIVLRGLTGVGKTVLLKRLEKEDYAILDIEGLANHRGSAFGGFGLPVQPSQKQFDALLWQKLRNTSVEDIIISEGESKLVGRVRLPARLYASLQTETSLWIRASLDFRAKIILDDYPIGPHLQEAFAGKIDGLKNRLGAKGVAELQGLLADGNWKELVRELMVQYYDPLYMHTLPERRIEIDIDETDVGYEELKRQIEVITGE